MARGRPSKSGDDVLLKSAELLGWAIGGLEREIGETNARLASLTAQANTLRERLKKEAGSAAKAAVEAASRVVSEPAEEGVEGGRTKKRRKMSAEAKRRISEMMKKRWAERKGGQA